MSNQPHLQDHGHLLVLDSRDVHTRPLKLLRGATATIQAHDDHKQTGSGKRREDESWPSMR